MWVGNSYVRDANGKLVRVFPLDMCQLLQNSIRFDGMSKRARRGWAIDMYRANPKPSIAIVAMLHKGLR